MYQLKSSHLPLDKPSQNAVPVFKSVGKTPLQMVEEYRATHGIDPAIKISYAGRLDPMAEGVLLVLVGDENKKRDEYLNLPKKYICEVLFGVYTDSFDVMGRIEKVEEVRVNRPELEAAMTKFKGSIMQKFPPYSSKTVNGKPLYYWAHHDKLQDIEIPQEERVINQIKIEEFSEISGRDLYDAAIEKIKIVEGDFRQEEILADWEIFIQKYADQVFPLAKISVDGSSGLYIRQLAVDLGDALGVPAMAYSIARTSVGPYSL